MPQNIPDLIELTGGEDAFCKRLDEFFTSDETSGAKNDNASGFVGLYAHGNEPSHHVAIFTPWPVSRPRPNSWWSTSSVPLWHNTSSSGYAGNDDCGEMSAWYVFSALGFYPVNPASGEYVIGSPTVDHAEIMLPGGKKFTIVVERKGGAGAVYVKSVKLNGHKLDGYVLKHADIMKGARWSLRWWPGPKGKCWICDSVTGVRSSLRWGHLKRMNAASCLFCSGAQHFYCKKLVKEPFLSS